MTKNTLETPSTHKVILIQAQNRLYALASSAGVACSYAHSPYFEYDSLRLSQAPRQNLPWVLQVGENT